MEKIISCEKCFTTIVIDLGMRDEYYGPVIKCGLCNSMLIMASFVFHPHIVPTRPYKTLYWSGTLTTFPNLTIEPLIIENTIDWVYPPLPSIGYK